MSSRRRPLLGLAAVAGVLVAAVALWRAPVAGVAARGAAASPTPLDEGAEEPAVASTDEERPDTDSERRAVEESSGPSSVVEVLVIDTEGDPVRGASVAWPSVRGEIVRLTDAGGRALLPVDTSIQGLDLHVRGPDYFRDRRFHLRAPTIRVVLRRSHPLRATLVDRDTGDPVAAQIVLRPFEVECWCAPDVAETDAEGQFLFPEVPTEQSFRLWITASGYPDTAFTVDPNTSVPTTITLDRGAELFAARVVDAQTGEGLEGAWVEDDIGTRLSADSTGRIHGWLRPEEDRWHDPADWQLPLSASAPGYLGLRASVRVGSISAKEEVVIPLIPPATVRGTVVNVQHRPLSGARVVFDPPTAPGPTSQAWKSVQAAASETLTIHGWLDRRGAAVAWTNSEGRFRVGGLVPWVPEYLETVTWRGRTVAEWTPLTSGLPGSELAVEILARPADPRAAVATVQR